MSLSAVIWMLAPGRRRLSASIHMHATYCATSRRYKDREKGRTRRKSARAIMLAPMHEATRAEATRRKRRERYFRTAIVSGCLSLGVAKLAVVRHR